MIDTKALLLKTYRMAMYADDPMTETEAKRLFHSLGQVYIRGLRRRGLAERNPRQERTDVAAAILRRQRA